MNSAVAGLLGALIGAAAGLAGAWITSSREARREQAKWLLEARVNAYSGAIRHLYRASYRMTRVSAEFGPIVDEEHIKEWFDDVVEALYYVVWSTVVCGNRQLDALQKAQYDLDTAVSRLNRARSLSHPKSLRYQLAETYQAVHPAARADLGGSIVELSRTEVIDTLKREAEDEAEREAK